MANSSLQRNSISVLTTSKDIKRAFQALAIDEHREAFSPTLWRLPEAKAATEEEMERQRKAVEEASSAWYNIDSDAKASPQKRKDVKAAWNRARQTLIYMEESQRPPSELLQVWFPGVHINVGGGSSDTLKNEGDLEGKNLSLSSVEYCEQERLNLTLFLTRNVQCDFRMDD